MVNNSVNSPKHIFNDLMVYETFRSGVKYILRTDVMFRNADQELGGNLERAVQLLQQAETLEVGGWEVGAGQDTRGGWAGGGCRICSML